MTERIEVHPASPDRWQDLETLFGKNGGYSNCWCLFWRVRRAEFNKMQPPERQAALKDMTLKNEVPGLLAYREGIPVGWISVGRRESFTALEYSRVLKRVDDAPVWSIVCFFVAKTQRGQGVMAALLQGAVDYARSQGAKIIEGYPLDLQAAKLKGKKLTGCTGYMGIVSAFRQAGFQVVGEASETQCIMRLVVN